MSIDYLMGRFLTACNAIASDYADTRIRGYLKTHPDAISVFLNEVERVAAEVRAQVTREQESAQWIAKGWDPKARGLEELTQSAAEYAEHTCSCEYCLHGGGFNELEALKAELERIESLPAAEDDRSIRWVLDRLKNATDPEQPIGVKTIRRPAATTKGDKPECHNH
ncbi:hypothetical protein [Streptomyces sp. CAI-85]|uniref:hypothetical protein n=1 Tax=Streptomyces sp. CAI-85 TaxID=1472662 RepID=UPI001587E37C|nr:hypothetical protein [Streptomyces sp. CAI-85]NUV60655.1 hypothetical protein [Streptomyces sp. CAI-85]